MNISKRTLSLFRISSIALGFIAFIVAPLRAQTTTEFWVAKDGDDNALGGKETPFKSLEKARDSIRALKANGGLPAGGVTVWIRSGSYERSACFELDSRDSGLPEGPIVYSAAPGEKVSLIGGRVVPSSSFKQAIDRDFLERVIDPAARRRIIQVNLRELGILDYGELVPIDAVDFGSSNHYALAPLEVFVDGKSMTLSRWPNADQENPIRGSVDRVRIITDLDGSGKPAGYSKIIVKGTPPSAEDGREGGQASILAWDRMKRWNSDDIWISGGLVRAYAYGQRKIQSIDKNSGIVTLDTPVPLWANYNQKEVYPTFFQNVPEELDSPGEYYIDRKAGILSLYPPSDWNSNSEVLVSELKDPLVSMEGCSHVRLRGLTLETSRSSGVFIARGDDNIVEKCVIRNVGTVGVQIGMGWDSGITGQNPWHPESVNGSSGKLVSRVPGSLRNMFSTGIGGSGTALNLEAGKANGVLDSRIFNTGAGGVILGGGDRKTLSPAGNFIKGSELFHTDRRIERYAEAVLIAGVGNVVSENYIHDSKAGLVYIHGNDHVLEFNEIANAVSESTDCGAVEIRQNPSQLGNIIRYNYIHSTGRGRNAQSYVIYLDNESCGVTVFGNVIANTRGRIVEGYKAHTVAITRGFANVIANNIFIDNDGGLVNDGELSTLDVFKARKFMLVGDVDVTQAPYASRYPEFLEIYTRGADAKPHNSVFNNVLLGCGAGIGESRYPEEGFWHNNYETDVDPGFVDEKNGDYNLRPNSIVFQKIPGFEPIPFSKMKQAKKWGSTTTKQEKDQ